MRHDAVVGDVFAGAPERGLIDIVVEPEVRLLRDMQSHDRFEIYNAVFANPR